MSGSNEDLIAELNKETARLSWEELERHFARGSVIKVAAGVDLIEVAALFANDEAKTIEAQIAEGKVGHATMDDARIWNDSEAEFWAVVVAPWVLVQLAERKLDS